jgi:cytochrome c553
MEWAYLYSDHPHALAAPPHDQVIHVPGSPVSYAWKQLSQSPQACDWFPSDHPPMPDVVAKDWSEKSIPCADCHWSNGLGHLATASLAALPRAYVVDQLKAFRSGHRHSTDTRLKNVQLMIGVAGEVNPAQAAEAAAYFAGLRPKPWVRVVEADSIPTTLIDRYGWRDLDPAGGVESIDHRIVEVAEDEHRMNSSDPTSGILAYVPPGSIRRGEAPVLSGEAYHGLCELSWSRLAQSGRGAQAGRTDAHLSRSANVGYQIRESHGHRCYSDDQCGRQTEA